MTSRHLLPALLLIVAACAPDDSAYQALKDELTTIRERNQRYRMHMDSVARKEGWQSDAVAELYEKQRELDSVNLAAIDGIITRFGYPSKARVGGLSTVPFEVLRHCDEPVKADYLDLVVGAGQSGDIPMNLVAVFEDRVLVSQKQPQRYGTQIWIEFVEDRKTGERYDSVYLWPVRNPGSVEARRAAAGLDSLTDQLRHYGIDPSKGFLLRKSGQGPNG